MRFELPPRLDLLVALGVAALALAEAFADPLHPFAASVPLGLVQAAAVAFRRRAPLPALVVAIAALFVQTAAGVSLHTPVTPIVVGLIAVYSVAQYEPLPRAAAGLATALGGLFGAIQLAVANGEKYSVADRLFVAVFIVAPWLVGRALHGRTREAEELAVRAASAVEDERDRIARELHDVIAHSLSVVVVQAGAGERVPEQAQEALRTIQHVGREALAEMSRLVGVLRQGGEEIGLTQNGLAQLNTLLAESGLAVELHIDGETRPLPPGLDLSAYRIVQEALTNARKHAGDARVDVTLRYDEQRLVIEVVDDGVGTIRGEGGGHGLLGMRERTAVFGGTLDAGPRPERGFAVRATLPYEDPRT